MPHSSPESPGRTISGSDFPDDTGAPAADVRAALTAYAGGAGGYAEAVAALAGSRVLVPVVALLGEVEQDAAGLTREKDSEMAAVLLRGVDGRLALLAFTGLDALHGWNAEARPVPVSARTAAASAVAEGAAALVVDVAGPGRLVVEGEDLTALADGWRPARVGDRLGWIRPSDPGSANILR